MNKVGLLADDTEAAQAAAEALIARYDLLDLRTKSEQTDIVIILGGDGFMLHSMHRLMQQDVLIYGMNCGTVGFLMNNFSAEDLHARLRAAEITKIHPLLMTAVTVDGETHTALAINEVSLLRKHNQAAKIKIYIDDNVRIAELVCDGVMVATPAGSTAYNFSAGGPIIPIGSNLLALTAISSFRPRRWKGALLPHAVTIVFETLEADKRPINAYADFHEVKDIKRLEIKEVINHQVRLLFDPGHSLEERIIREQFEH